MLLRLVRFEFSKAMKSFFNRSILALLCLALIGYYFWVYDKTVRPEEVALEKEAALYQMEELVETLQADYGDKPNYQEMQEIEHFEKILERDRRELEGFINEDWTTVLNAEIERAAFDLDAQITSRQYYTSSFSTLFTQETHREYLRFLRDHGIEPVLPLHTLAWYTVYDELFPMNGSDHEDFLKEFVHKASDKYSSLGVGYTRRIAEFLFNMSGVILFILLFGDVVTKEGLGRNGPIHLIRTQPIPKSAILASKMLAIIGWTLLIMMGIGTATIALGTLLDGLGDWQYPILVYGEEYRFEFISTQTYLLKSMMLFMVVLLFSYALLFLYSIVAKRMMVAIVLTVGTILFGIQLAEEMIETPFSHFIPFQYVNPTKIITMEKAASFKNFNFDFTNAVLSLGVAFVILIVLIYVIDGWQTRHKGA